jgi:hypothetical protein
MAQGIQAVFSTHLVSQDGQQVQHVLAGKRGRQAGRGVSQRVWRQQEAAAAAAAAGCSAANGCSCGAQQALEGVICMFTSAAQHDTA